MALSRCAPLSTAELVRCAERGVPDTASDLQMLDLLYGDQETTSEKISTGYNLDGLVSAVVGTHTHVQTADETILERGTAYLTDAGMCGPAVGVLGREREPILQRFRTSMPAKFPVANWPVRLCGAVVQIDEATGRALSIARINKIVEKPAS